MSTARLQLLPTDQLDDKQFESFLLQFLGAGISLEVNERMPARERAEPELTEPPSPTCFTARHRIVRATLVGSTGQKQHGIDIIAYPESGSQWVFQCKHWPKKRFDVAAAKEVMTKAQTEYPEASRYFVALSHPATKPVEVRRIVEADPKWQLWDPSEIWTRFQNEVPREKQLDIVRRFFGEDAAKQLYPLQHDSLLLSASDYFSRSSPINFGTQFVGREAELAQLLTFARSPEPTAAILSAPGGIGKTRLLREFAERLASGSPDLRVLFLNPDASAQANTDALRVAEAGKLVVVFDDAHRSETLRDDIADSVAAKKGRLLLSARPEAIEARRVWLTNHGFPAVRCAEPIRLQPLAAPQLQRLATAELGPALAAHANRLAARAKGNALLVTVAADLLRTQPGASVESLLASEDFGQRILDHLADKTLRSAFAEGDQRDRARDVLHVLAILAPWTEQVLPLDRIAALLDCGEREFNRVLDALLAAKLVVRTGRGLRVVPDLLADHLVRRACFEPGSERRLTSLAKALQKELAPTISCTSALHVIRNLAEAEAQHGVPDGGLVEPFWQEFKRQFEGAQLWMREHLLSEWSSFAVAQPARSLALARLALATIDNPPMPDGVGTEIVETPSPAHRDRVLAAAAELLEPVASHCPAQRSATFDLLWSLDRQAEPPTDKDASATLAVLGRIAGWDNHRRLDAVNDLLGWLFSLLSTTDGKQRLLDRRSPALSVLLKPVFECGYDWIESDPTSTEARLAALPENDIAPLYTVALDLIEQQVLPAGEVALLNCHGVLESALAASPHHGRWWVLPAQMRLRALRLVATLLDDKPSPRVVFRFRETLRGILDHEPAGPFREEVQALIDSIPDTTGLRLAIVLLSNRWKEFVHHLPRAELPGAHEKDTMRPRWEQFTTRVATELTDGVTDGRALLAAIDQLAREYLFSGEAADFTELLAAISRIAPALARDCLSAALDLPQTAFDRSLLSLVAAGDHAVSTEQLADRILGNVNHARWSAFLQWLGWYDRDSISQTLLKRLGDWAAHLDDDGLRAILPSLGLWHPTQALVTEIVLEHLPLSSLAEPSIAELCRKLASLRLGSEALELPPSFCRALIAELHRLKRFEIRHQPSCLPWLARKEPRAFLQMLERRITEAAKLKRVLPLGLNESILLHELPHETDYSELADRLLSQVRNSTSKLGIEHWTTLFQWAVLRVSPLGLELLEKWLPETHDAEDLGRLIRCLRFSGSRHVFEQRDFVQRILARIREIVPTQSAEFRTLLASTGSPTSWSSSGGEPAPEARRYREEAAKAAAIHSADPELAVFYRLIVEQEDAHAAFLRRPYASDDEWSYD